MNKQFIEKCYLGVFLLGFSSVSFFVFVDPETEPWGQYLGLAVKLGLVSMAMLFVLGAMHLMAVSMRLYDESFLSAIKTHPLNAFLSFIFIIISISLFIYFIFL